MYAINVYDKISNVNRSCAINELHLIVVAVAAATDFFALKSTVLLFLYSTSRFRLPISVRLLALMKSTMDELIGLCYNNEH